MFVYVKNSVEKACSASPAEIALKALVEALVEGSDPAAKLAKCLGQDGFGVEQIEVLEKHDLTQTETRFRTLAAAIGKAFLGLQKHDFLTREAHGCCYNHALPEVVNEARDSGRSKFAFYTKSEVLVMQFRGYCVIRYGAVNDVKTEDEQRRRVRKIGQHVEHALKEQGLAVAWDGDPEVAIRVRLKEE